MALNAITLDEALDAMTFDLMTLHSGAPGAAGDQNVVSDAPVACSFAAATDNGDGKRKRQLSAAVEFTSATPTTNVVWFGLWEAGAPNVYRGEIERTAGDAQTNAAGEYTATTGNKLILGNAS